MTPATATDETRDRVMLAKKPGIRGVGQRKFAWSGRSWFEQFHRTPVETRVGQAQLRDSTNFDFNRRVMH